MRWSRLIREEGGKEEEDKKEGVDKAHAVGEFAGEVFEQVCRIRGETERQVAGMQGRMMETEWR